VVALNKDHLAPGESWLFLMLDAEALQEQTQPKIACRKHITYVV